MCGGVEVTRPIIIKDSNRERIEKLIKTAEGKAYARCLTFDELSRAVEALEKKLDLLPKSERVGATAVVFDGQSVPNRYEHAGASTYAELARLSGGWAVVKAWRDRTPSVSYGGQLSRVVSLRVSKSQADGISRRYIEKLKLTIVQEGDVNHV